MLSKDFLRLMQTTREATNLTRAELGKRAGRSESYVSKLESGLVKNPKVQDLRAIFDAARMDMADKPGALLSAAGYSPEQSKEMILAAARKFGALLPDEQPRAMSPADLRRIADTIQQLRGVTVEITIKPA